MTEPDEALLWARERAKARMSFPNNPHRWIVARHAEVDAGKQDDEGRVKWRAQGYRAGAAASAERIKELEARIKALEAAIRDANKRLKDYTDMTVDQWGETVADGGITAWMVIRQELQTVIAGGLARALLKEADQ